MDRETRRETHRVSSDKLNPKKKILTKICSDIKLIPAGIIEQNLVKNRSVSNSIKNRRWCDSYFLDQISVVQNDVTNILEYSMTSEWLNHVHSVLKENF